MYNKYRLKITSDDLCFLDWINLYLINEDIENYNFFSFMGDGFIEIEESYFKLITIIDWIRENYSTIDYKCDLIKEYIYE